MITKFTTTKKKYIENTQANPNTNNTFEVRKTYKKLSKNQTNVKVFGRNFFREGRPQLFYGRLLARPTVNFFDKVWLSSVY